MAKFQKGQRVTVVVDESELAPARDGGWTGKNGTVLRSEDDRVLVHLGKIYQWAWFYEYELEEWKHVSVQDWG